MKKQTKKVLILIVCLCIVVSCVVLFLLFTNIGGPKSKEQYKFYLNNNVSSYIEGSEIEEFDRSININGQQFYGIPLIGDDHILLTTDMIYYPVFSYSRSKVDHSSKIYVNEKNSLFINKNKEYNADFGFLFDGKYTFIPLQSVTLNVNSKTINLSALSYIYCDDYSLSYFDYNTKETGQIVLELEKVEVCCDSYKISIGESLYVIDDNSLLLSRSCDNYDSVFGS